MRPRAGRGPAAPAALGGGIEGVVQEAPAGPQWPQARYVAVDAPLPPGGTPLVRRQRAVVHLVAGQWIAPRHAGCQAGATHQLEPERVVLVPHRQEPAVADAAIVDSGEVADAVTPQHVGMARDRRR